MTTSEPSFLLTGTERDELRRDIRRLEIEETRAGLRTLRASFCALPPLPGSGPELPVADLDFGAKLEVKVHDQPLFRGVISAIELELQEDGELLFAVLAEDALMKLRMTRRCKSYEHKSDADIAQAIAGEHGLSAQVSAEGPSYDVVQQWNMSDLAFLRERARLCGAEVWLADDKLFFQTRAQRSDPALPLVFDEDLVCIQIRADLAHQRSSVKVSGYDAKGREAIEEEAGPDVLQAESGGGRTGPSLLEKALGKRDAQRVREAPLTSEEAKAFAKAEMLQRGRSFVTARGVTYGTPGLMVGRQLKLEGAGALFSGDHYYATWVCHSYDPQHGFRTAFEAERASINEAK